MSSIDGIAQYYVPNTLDGLNPITSEVNASALLIDGSNAMAADLNVGNHRIKNLQAGVSSTEAVNVGQLANYALDSTVVHLAGTETITGNKTFAGTLSMNNQKITSLANGTAATDAATYGQLTAISGNYLPITGGTITGNLAVNGTTTLGLTNQQTTVHGSIAMNVATPLGTLHVANAGAGDGTVMLEGNGSKFMYLKPGIVNEIYNYYQQNPTTFPSSSFTIRHGQPGGATTPSLTCSDTSVSLHSLPLTNVAAGSISTDGVNLGQVNSLISSATSGFALDSTVVHNTGNETVAGQKTFTTSPIVPNQPTSINQATSQKMVVAHRSAAWNYPIVTAEQSTGPLFDTFLTSRFIAVSPWDLGTVPLQAISIGSNANMNQLHISCGYFHAGLTYDGMAVMAGNFNSVFNQHQYPTVKMGIWDKTTGALLAETNNTALQINTIGANITRFDNYFLPFQATGGWMPTVSKQYIYGVWWSTITNYINNSNMSRTTQVTNADVMQSSTATTYSGPLQASGFKTGITSFPTTLPLTGWTPSTGLYSFWVMSNYATIW